MVAGTGLAHLTAGLIRSLADSLLGRASSQYCRTVITIQAGTNQRFRLMKETAMHMLAKEMTHVIGVDTHRDTHSVAILETSSAGVIACAQFDTNSAGYQAALSFGCDHTSTRVWAIEGTGSYGSGLATMLLSNGEVVVEIDRPGRTSRRDGIKTDEVDAIRAAREALSRQHLAVPRVRGEREALRVGLTARNGAITARTSAISQLKAVLVRAPPALRERMTGTTWRQLRSCAKLRVRPDHGTEYRATVRSARAIAKTGTRP